MDNIIYILINESMPGYVKIGKTSNLEQRIRSLDTTSIPLPFECFYACRVKDATFVERQLLDAFMDHRVRSSREFFEIAPERAVSILKLVAIEDVTPKKDFVESKEDLLALNQARTRRARFNFKMVDIPIGSELTFSRNENIKAKVINNRNIEFNGKITNLSTAAQEALGVDYGVAGTDYWMYDGETLDRRRRRFEEGNDDEIMQTTNKKECPKCKSIKIRDAGVRMGAAVAVLPGREIPEPRQPIYECEDCGENFFIE